MDQINLRWIRTTTQKFLKISMKNKRHNWMWRILHAHQRQKAKPQRRELASCSSSIIPMNERNWIDIEPGNHSLSSYEVSKKVIHLLRHSQKVHREEDAAVHFWRKKIFRAYPQIYSLVWRSMESMLGRKRSKKEISVLHRCFRNNCLPPSSSTKFRDAILLILHCKTMWWFKADSSTIFNTLDVLLIFILSSTMDWHLEVRIQARERVFFLPVDPRDKEHKDLGKIDLNVPRRAQYMHNAWK